jgi:glutamate racemase
MKRPGARKRKAAPVRRARRAAAADGAGAIGVFDSGVGGLTVAQQLTQALPREHLIYFGDTARYPYGTKSAETVRAYALENAEFLVDKGIKMLVVACNTVAAVALDLLRSRFDIPVIGVVEPGAAAAVRATRGRKVGVIGTEGTISSGAYTRALRALQPSLEIYTRACPLFVPLAEEGWVDNDVARRVASLYLNSLKRSGIDTLVLGCTHYPLLADVIQAVVGEGVRLVDSARTTAVAAGRELRHLGLARRSGTGSVTFFVSDVPDRFIKVGSRFMGQKVESAVRIER